MNRDSHIIHFPFRSFCSISGTLHPHHHARIKINIKGHLNSAPGDPTSLGAVIYDKFVEILVKFGGIPPSQVIIADRLGLMVLLDHELGEVFGRSAT